MRSGMCEVFDIEVGTFEFLKESHFRDSRTQGISVSLLISHISLLADEVGSGRREVLDVEVRSVIS